MVSQHTKRYCADPDALAAMKRDGMGWGHDLDCGCFRDMARKKTPRGLSRLINVFKRRV